MSLRLFSCKIRIKTLSLPCTRATKEYHTWAYATANYLKMAQKRGASHRICAVLLQTSLPVFRRSITFSFLKIWCTSDTSCRFPPPHVFLFPSAVFQLNTPFPLSLSSVPLILGSTKDDHIFSFCCHYADFLTCLSTSNLCMKSLHLWSFYLGVLIAIQAWWQNQTSYHSQNLPITFLCLWANCTFLHVIKVCDLHQSLKFAIFSWFLSLYLHQNSNISISYVFCIKHGLSIFAVHN